MIVKPKREQLDLNEIALATMVAAFSKKKDDFTVLQEQITQLEKKGMSDDRADIRKKLDLGETVPSADLRIELTESIEKRKDTLETEVKNLSEQKKEIVESP